MRNVLQLLEKSEKLNPKRVAISDENRHVTYEEYVHMAKVIGTFFARRFDSLSSTIPIAVLIDRNIKTLVAFAGVVYGGGFYVPIDMNMPEERVNLIVNSLKPVAILDARENFEEKSGVFCFDNILQENEIDENLLQIIRDNKIDLDPLYAIYTSGSTGVPKGVLISHRGVLDLTEAFDETFHFKDGTVFGNQAPFDFDVSTKDIYCSLFSCGTVSIIPKKCFATPGLLKDYLLSREITTVIWAVSALRIIADYKVFDLDGQIPRLENVMFSGEVMPLKTLKYLREKLPDANFVNLYGPTEITCNCTYYKIEKNKEYEKALPIGKAFYNTRVMLCNDKREVIRKENEIGEICVEGTCNALGYWDNFEKTENAFLRLSETKEYQRRIYATGDMGYYGSDGEMYFASRRDYQIKHMGHRIELGEIEAALNSIDFITIGVCVYDEERQKIVCFYQAEKDCKKEIILELAKKIQKYMWPNAFCRVEEMPMTKNGKIDRIMLKKRWESENGKIN